MDEYITLFFSDFIEPFEVAFVGFPYHLTEPGVRANPLPLHLQTDQFAGERNSAHVETSTDRFHHNPVASSGAGMLRIFEKLFA